MTVLTGRAPQDDCATSYRRFGEVVGVLQLIAATALGVAVWRRRSTRLRRERSEAGVDGSGLIRRAVSDPRRLRCGRPGDCAARRRSYAGPPAPCRVCAGKGARPRHPGAAQGSSLIRVAQGGSGGAAARSRSSASASRTVMASAVSRAPARAFRSSSAMGAPSSVGLAAIFLAAASQPRGCAPLSAAQQPDRGRGRAGRPGRRRPSRRRADRRARASLEPRRFDPARRGPWSGAGAQPAPRPSRGARLAPGPLRASPGLPRASPRAWEGAPVDPTLGLPRGPGPPSPPSPALSKRGGF